MKIRDLVPHGLLITCIFKLLNTGPKHGYEIIKSIKEETGWKPSPGAVYPTLHELKKRGLIEEKKVERRISYKLTAEGKIAAEKIEENMEEMKNKFHNFIETMGQIIGLKESELRRMIEIHEKKVRGSFLLLPEDIRMTMIKISDLITKIVKDKEKHKKLKCLLDDLRTKLEKIEGE
jgi:DNA-binding PadR family transcriptional regulator